VKSRVLFWRDKNKLDVTKSQTHTGILFMDIQGYLDFQNSNRPRVILYFQRLNNAFRV